MGSERCPQHFPTTSGAYDTTYNGPTLNGVDSYVSRLSMGVAFYADRRSAERAIRPSSRGRIASAQFPHTTVLEGDRLCQEMLK